MSTLSSQPASAADGGPIVYADTTRINARAAALRASASELRSKTATVIANVEACAWSSPSGDAVRSSTTAMVVELGRQAQHLDDAAASLAAHARAVDEAKARIEAAARAVDGARELVGL